eukprot:958579-Lingulodinium_polyedra.AAC.1
MVGVAPTIERRGVGRVWGRVEPALFSQPAGAGRPTLVSRRGSRSGGDEVGSGMRPPGGGVWPLPGAPRPG